MSAACPARRSGSVVVNVRHSDRRTSAAERTRCGGTDFDAVRRYVNDPKRRGKYSAVLIMTDGYAPKMGAVVGSKVMWIITETGDTSAARPGDLVVKMGSESKTVKRV